MSRKLAAPAPARLDLQKNDARAWGDDVLVPCPKGDAETAAFVRQALREKLGDQAAAEILGRYKQRVMRDRNGWNQRYWVDAGGSTLRLAR